MKKITLEEAQNRLSSQFHILRYDGYSKYMKVHCDICGKDSEYQIAKSFILNQKCSKCNGYQKTTEEWIEKAKSIHGDKYDYSESKYINNKTNIKIFCKRCNEYFFQRPDVHLKSCGHICYKKEILSEKKTSNTVEFIKKMELKSPNKYGYDRLKYKRSDEKVEIFCKRCNDYFRQTPEKLLIGYGCFGCYLERSIEARKVSVEEFVERSKEKHGDCYDYSKVSFNKNSDYVEILCKSCGEYFKQTVAAHLAGENCPCYKRSNGEVILKNFFIKNNIDFEQNKTFDDLIDIGKLSYDFCINNILVEYNGIQHYRFVPYFHKDLHEFHKQLHHDWLKRKYALKNGYRLFVIKYNDNIIEKVSELLKSLNIG